MASSLPTSRRSFAQLLHRLFWPTAMLLCGTIGFVLLTIFLSSQTADMEAAERQRLQLAAAIEQRLQDLESQLATALRKAVESPADLQPGDALRQSSARIVPLFDVSAVYWVDATGLPAVSPAEGDAAGRAAFEVAGVMLPELIRSAELRLSGLPVKGSPLIQLNISQGLTRLLRVDGSVYGLVAVPNRVPSADGFILAVGMRRIDEASLRRLAELHGVRDFAVHSGPLPADQAGLGFGDERIGTAAHLSWTADRPGQMLLERLLPLTLIGTIVTFAMFAFIMGHVRTIARDLAATQEKAQSLVGRDPLCGLPNRLLFGERLDQELARISRTGEGLAVMFLDLDRFKEVNDTYGHQAGDELLKRVAERLGRLLRGADTLARFGGDEFAVIQTQVRSRVDAESLARRILDELTHPFELGEAPVSVGVSIGVALAPEHGLDREGLMRLADTALYQSKSEGRNRYSFFVSQMDEAIRLRKVVEDDLRDAIATDQLALHYQPLFSADGQTVVGLEALVRWPHPTQGLIAPDRFIPMAEERGLIIPLGEWVLRRAFTDGKRWPGLRIAVNVSPIQFRHRDFVAKVVDALEETGFDATRLELELTEGVVVEDADAAEAAMMELRALGVHLALDDFGTGYSSLIYLRRFAFDKIKIDRSFLESMEATGESAILVHSIVHLGRALGLTVTAEGVETKEQHRFLQALGCHQLQGFLFSRPIPAAEVDVLLGIAPPDESASAA
ncbi:putative bifunctional diguanylate cyclase/phosphodiesterase [Salinarimonas soli]|uniref:EAL domain-containing protein n=1 Tax=Salinarimonas soli TaxID=1638099 RepID=A0A5B2VGX9_9HYPH|nr:EAL domain-containing protein [Salinarimonas soli]KAA2238185.1 EAL domain-containing protein [Salinarimonas soli]